MTPNHSTQQTSHKRCIGRKKWWLLLLRREASENGVEDKAYTVFLGGRAFQGGLGLKELWGLILRQTQGLVWFFFFRVGPGHCPASGACEKSGDQAWLLDLLSGRVWLLEPFKGSQCLAVGVPQSWHQVVEASQGQGKPLLSPRSV